jgi:hypothetical protein
MQKQSKQIDKGTTKITHAKQHDSVEQDKDGMPVDVKKETKHTTVIKPSVKGNKDKQGGPTASAGQRKQMKELCE